MSWEQHFLCQGWVEEREALPISVDIRVVLLIHQYSARAAVVDARNITISGSKGSIQSPNASQRFKHVLGT